MVDSGETHLLSPAAIHLLAVLENGPRSLEVLAHEFESLVDDADSDLLSALLQETIDSVRQIGLIETVETIS